MRSGRASAAGTGFYEGIVQRTTRSRPSSLAFEWLRK